MEERRGRGREQQEERAIFQIRNSLFFSSNSLNSKVKQLKLTSFGIICPRKMIQAGETLLKSKIGRYLSVLEVKILFIQFLTPIYVLIRKKSSTGQ